MKRSVAVPELIILDSAFKNCSDPTHTLYTYSDIRGCIMKCVKPMATLTTVIMMMFLKTNALDSIFAVTVPYVFISNLARDFLFSTSSAKRTYLSS